MTPCSSLRRRHRSESGAGWASSSRQRGGAVDRRGRGPVASQAAPGERHRRRHGARESGSTGGAGAGRVESRWPAVRNTLRVRPGASVRAAVRLIAMASPRGNSCRGAARRERGQLIGGGAVDAPAGSRCAATPRRRALTLSMSMSESSSPVARKKLRSPRRARIDEPPPSDGPQVHQRFAGSRLEPASATRPATGCHLTRRERLGRSHTDGRVLSGAVRRGARARARRDDDRGLSVRRRRCPIGAGAATVAPMANDWGVRAHRRRHRRRLPCRRSGGGGGRGGAIAAARCHRRTSNSGAPRPTDLSSYRGAGPR